MKKLVVLMMCSALIGSVQAAPVVRNAGFETTPLLWSGTYSDHGWGAGWITPNWDVSSGGGVGLNLGNYAYANNGMFLGQQALEADGVTASLVEAGMELTFQFDMKSLGSGYEVAAGGFYLQLLTMAHDVISSTGVSPTVDVWTTTSVTTTAVGAGSPLIGQEYYYRFMTYDTDGWAQGHVDNVSIVPEPATMVLLGLGGLLLRKKR